MVFSEDKPDAVRTAAWRERYEPFLYKTSRETGKRYDNSE
jgi:hypothetical protein